MTTALDLITDSLQLLGVYAPGETVTDADAQRGLNTLNQMMDQWSNLSLVTYEVLEQSATLVPGTQSYTIGTGGVFNMTRPIRLLDGPGRAYVLDTNGNSYDLNVVDRAYWNQIGNTSPTVVTSNFPNTLFYDPQFPLGVMWFYPTPSISYTAYWDSMLQLARFTSLTSLLSLPPGYERAIVTNLAVKIKPYFLSAPLDPEVAIEATIALGDIKRSNLRPMRAQFDGEIVTKSRGVYNPYTDGQGGGTR